MAATAGGGACGGGTRRRSCALDLLDERQHRRRVAPLGRERHTGQVADLRHGQRRRLFPQPVAQPQRGALGHERHGGVVVPAAPAPRLVVVEPQLPLAFLDGLLHRPAEPKQPDQGLGRRVEGGRCGGKSSARRWRPARAAAPPSHPGRGGRRGRRPPARRRPRPAAAPCCPPGSAPPARHRAAGRRPAHRPAPGLGRRA